MVPEEYWCSSRIRAIAKMLIGVLNLCRQFEFYLSFGEVRSAKVERSPFYMKKLFSVPGVFILVLGGLATQSCESTDSQHAYYYRNHYGYYNDGRYAADNGYYNHRAHSPNRYEGR